MIRALLVDDDTLVARTLGRVLSRHVDIVDTVPDAATALRRIEHDDVDVVITDYDLGRGMTGVELAHTIRETRPSVRVVLVSGSFDPSHGPAEAWRVAVDAWFAKPVPAPELVATLQRLLPA